MIDQEEYISAGTTIAFSILAVSAVYFIDLADPRTYILSLAPILLFGYTAQNSNNSFERSSLGSLIALTLLPLGGLVAVLSFIIALTNPLISYFASGEGFQNYYSSTALPLITIGVLAGFLTVSATLVSPQFNEKLENNTNQIVSTHTSVVTDYMNPDEDLNAVENTARSTVTETESIVVEEVQEDVGNEEIEELRDGFDEAREEAPSEIKESIEGQRENSIREQRIENTVQSISESFYQGRTLYTVIILVPLLFYSFQPVLGVLTAIFATIFAKVEYE